MKTKPQSRNPAIYFILACGGCLLIPLLLCCVLALTGTTFAVIAERSKVTETETETFSLTDVDRPLTLSVENSNGTINVVGGDDLDEIEARYEITGRSFNKGRAQEAVDSVSIVTVDDLSTDSELSISVTSNDVDFEGLMPLIRRVDITVHVPVETSLVLETSNGSVEVSNIAAENITTVTTGNGHITVMDSTFSGDLDVTTSNGVVELQDITASRNLTLNSSNGDVIATNLTAQRGFVIETSNGDIDFSGTVEGDFRYVVETSNGDISVNLTGDVPPLQIEANVGNGRLTNNLRLTTDSQENSTSIDGYYNGGSMTFPEDPESLPELIIETNNGDITIRAR
jgi:hypothetical protein